MTRSRGRERDGVGEKESFPEMFQHHCERMLTHPRAFLQRCSRFFS